MQYYAITIIIMLLTSIIMITSLSKTENKLETTQDFLLKNDAQKNDYLLEKELEISLLKITVHE